MPIELNGQNDIVRRNGNEPDEVVATKAGPSLTSGEVAYLEALPPQSKLKQAYLASTAKTELQAYQVAEAQALVSKDGKSFLAKSANIAARLTNVGQTVGVTPGGLLNPLDNLVVDIDGPTRTITPATNALHELRFPLAGSLAATADPVDKSLTIPIYIDKPADALVSNKFLVSVILSNNINTTSDTSGNGVAGSFTQWFFGVDYLRQGRNLLTMRHVDTRGAAGVGNNPPGAAPTDTLVGVDLGLPVQFVSIQVTNMAGVKINVGDVWRSAKQQPRFVFTMDANGSPGDETNFLTVLAPLCAEYGVKGAVTWTNVYEGRSAFGPSYLVSKELVEVHDWEVFAHGWNHGGTEVGRVAPVTLSRTSNLVTATFTSGAHNIPLNRQFRAAIRDSATGDLNGVFDCSANSATTIQYTAAGSNVTGVAANLYTYMAQVFDSDTPANFALLSHEMVDNKTEMEALGFRAASHCFGYPNHSVPELGLLKRVCKEAGITIARGVRGGFVFADQLGIDNPFEFGSLMMDSGSFATRTSTTIARLRSAWDRGCSVFMTGHYIVDERPLIAAGQVIDLEYAPGANGNPNPPAGALSGIGGWWYRGQVEAILKEATRLGFEPVKFSEFARIAGRGK